MFCGGCWNLLKAKNGFFWSFRYNYPENFYLTHFAFNDILFNSVSRRVLRLMCCFENIYRASIWYCRIALMYYVRLWHTVLCYWFFGMKGGEVKGLRFGGGFENYRDTNFKNWCPLYIKISGLMLRKNCRIEVQYLWK